jgi:hypothetical protein
LCIGLVDNLPVPAEATLPPAWTKETITPDNVQQIGAGLAWLDTFTSAGKKHLKSHVRQFGSVPVGIDTQWHIAKKDNDSWHMRYALKVLQDADLTEEELASVLSINKRGLDALRRSRPSLVDDVYLAARMPRKPKEDLRLGK